MASKYAALHDDDQPKSATSKYAALHESSDSLSRDGVDIPQITPNEEPAFRKWAKANRVNDPFNTEQHYDYVGAFRAGEGRQTGADGHFTDRFKLPGHETFSDESQYATGKFAERAGHWDGDEYTAPGGLAFQKVGAPDEQPIDPIVPKEEPRSAARTIATGLLQNQPFKEEIGGGIEALIEKARGNPAALVDLYRQYRDENTSFWDAEKAKNGLTGTALGIVGSIPETMASMALPGGLIAQGAQVGALMGLDESRADITKGDIGGAAVDTGIGAGIGAASSYVAPKVFDAIAHPIKTAGAAMQLPQKAKDAFGNWFGGSSIAKWIGGQGDETTSGLLKSARVKDLEASIAQNKAFQDSAEEITPIADDVATRLARAVNQGRASIDDAGFAFNPGEFGDDFANMQADVIEQAARKHYPDVDPSRAGRGINMLDEVSRASRKAGSATKPSSINQGAGTRAEGARSSVDALTNPGAMPKQQDLSMSGIRQMNQMSKAPGYDRAWAPGRRGTERAQAIEAEIRSALPGATDDEVQAELAQALYPDTNWQRLKFRQSNFADSRIPEPSTITRQSEAPMSPAAGESIRNQAFRRDVSSGIQDEERELLRRAVGLKATVAEADAAAANKMVSDVSEGRRLQAVADSARDELGRIATSNSAIGKALGFVAGAKAGAAIGGIPGAIVGATAGAKGGSKIVDAIDLGGAAGQRLSQVSSWADRLAKRDDQIGLLARWALSSGKDQAARLAAIADIPGVQELIGTDE